MTDETNKTLIEKVEKYGAEYLEWLMIMLTHPNKIIDSTRKFISDGDKNTKLLMIMGISIFLGATMGAIIPDRPPLQAQAVIFVVVSILWVFLSFLVHYACKLIGGKAESGLGVSLMIQNLAFAYVVSNFFTLITISLVNMFKLFDESSYNSILSGGLLIGLQILILLYLVPVTVSHAHGFSGIKWVFATIFSACFALIFSIPIYAMQGC